MIEVLTFAYQKIDVEYRMQGEDGQLKGSGLYSYDLFTTVG
jgi:hypothetical protein